MSVISRKNVTRVGVVAVAGLAIAGAVASSATAKALTYTVSVNGTTTGTATLSANSDSNGVQFDDKTSGVGASCTSVTSTATAKLSTKAKAKTLATITKSSYTGCTVPAVGLTLTIKQVGKWPFVGTGPTSGGITPGYINKVNTTVTGSGCSFTATGTLDATYNNTTHVLRIAPAASNPRQVTVSKVPTGQCFGAINNNDKVEVTANFNVQSTKPAGTLSVVSN